MSTEYKLKKEIEAATILREQIASIAADDPDLIRDTIEGETSLHEIIADLVAQIAEDEAVNKGTAELIESLKGRVDRRKKNIETRRSLIAKALEVGEINRLTTPAGTVSVKAVPPKVIITEEADIPSRFFETPPPKISLKLVGDHLKDRKAALDEAAAVEGTDERAAALARVDADHPIIPGATLGNGTTTIQVRR